MINILNILSKTSGNLLNDTESLYLSSSIRIAWDAVERMRALALASGISDMSMEEIDEEIRQYKEERRTLFQA